MKRLDELTDRRRNGRSMTHLIDQLRAMRAVTELSDREHAERLAELRARAAMKLPLFDDARVVR